MRNEICCKTAIWPSSLSARREEREEKEKQREESLQNEKNEMKKAIWIQL